MHKKIITPIILLLLMIPALAYAKPVERFEGTPTRVGKGAICDSQSEGLLTTKVVSRVEIESLISYKHTRRVCEGNYTCQYDDKKKENTCQCAFGDFEVGIPGFKGNVCDAVPKDSVPISTLFRFAGPVSRLLLATVVGAGVMMVLVAGYVYMTAGGNSERVKLAKKLIVGAIAGVVLALVGYLILSTINPDLVAPPGS